MTRNIEVLGQKAWLSTVWKPAGSGWTKVTVVYHTEVIVLTDAIVLVVILRRSKLKLITANTILISVKGVHLRVICSSFLRLVQDASDEVTWVGPRRSQIVYQCQDSDQA